MYVHNLLSNKTYMAAFSTFTEQKIILNNTVTLAVVWKHFVAIELRKYW